MSAAISVLLVEDCDSHAKLVCRQLAETRWLSQWDVVFDVERVATLEEAEAHLTGNSPQVVVLDLNLPDGAHLSSLTRLHEFAPLVPIVILTGEQDATVGLRALRTGAQDYLVKGRYNGPLLVRVLLFAIERFGYAQQLRQNQAYLQMLLDNSRAMLWSTDHNLTLTSTIGAQLASEPSRKDKAAGLSVAEYLSTEGISKETAVSAHERALAGESMSFEIRHNRRDFHARVEPLRNGGKQIVGTAGVAIDVTDGKRLEEDFLWAHKIQQKLIPTESPRLPGYDVAGVCRPAEATGGDFFDYLPMLDGRQGFIIADVCHHGFAPALIMAELRILMRTLANYHESLSEVMGTANRAIFDDTDDDTFVTTFLAALDPQTRQLTCAAAGHVGYVLPAHGEPMRVNSTSLPLGVVRDLSVPCAEPITLSPGDVVVLMTDGFGDAVNSCDEQFTTQRALQVLQRRRECPAEEMLQSLLASVDEFSQGAPQTDDQTAVVIKVSA